MDRARLLEWLRREGACEDARKEIAAFPGARAAWEGCRRDHIRWVLSYAGPDPRRVVEAACRVARLAVAAAPADGVGVAEAVAALDAAEAWTRGEADAAAVVAGHDGVARHYADRELVQHRGAISAAYRASKAAKVAATGTVDSKGLAWLLDEAVENAVIALDLLTPGGGRGRDACLAEIRAVFPYEEVERLVEARLAHMEATGEDHSEDDDDFDDEDDDDFDDEDDDLDFDDDEDDDLDFDDDDEDDDLDVDAVDAGSSTGAEAG